MQCLGYMSKLGAYLLSCFNGLEVDSLGQGTVLGVNVWQNDAEMNCSTLFKRILGITKITNSFFDVLKDEGRFLIPPDK
jgi:hypothetical protein